MFSQVTEENSGSNDNWYALYVRARHEKKVEQQLQRIHVQTYLPLRRVLRQWSDRKKWIDQPLFSSYIFIQTDEKGRYNALRTFGAVKIISFNGKPAVVQKSEIENIKNILRENPSAESCPILSAGDRVLVIRGPLTGLQGNLLEIKNKHRLVVAIDSIKQAMCFDVDISDINVVK